MDNEVKELKRYILQRYNEAIREQVSREKALDMLDNMSHEEYEQTNKSLYFWRGRCEAYEDLLLR